MTELTQQQLLDAYAQAGLTPVLIILGGSRSYGMPDVDDYDYFGYHLEDDWGGEIARIDDASIKSYSISTIQPALDGEYLPGNGMNTIDNWLYHQVIYSLDPQYSNIRAQIIAGVEEDWMRFYAFTAFGLFKAWKAEPTNTKYRNNAVRMALTVKNYIDNGTLECNWTTLTTLYPISTDEERQTLKKELKQIFIGIIADRIKWEALI